MVPGAAARLFPMLLVAPTDLRPPRGLSCWTCPLCVPVGDGPPARSPHASFARSGRSRSPAGPAAAHRHRGLALLWSLQRRAKPSNAVQPRGGLQSVGDRCLFVARPGPAAAHRHRGSSFRCPPHRWCGATTAHRHRGLDHSRINKPSTTCAHAQWCNACPWGGVRIRGWACWCGRCTRSVGIAPVLIGCSAT